MEYGTFLKGGGLFSIVGGKACKKRSPQADRFSSWKILHLGKKNRCF